MIFILYLRKELKLKMKPGLGHNSKTIFILLETANVVVVVFTVVFVVVLSVVVVVSVVVAVLLVVVLELLVVISVLSVVAEVISVVVAEGIYAVILFVRYCGCCCDNA